MKRYNFEYYDDAPHDSGMEEDPKGEFIRYDEVPFLAFPCHCNIMSSCCGIFMDIREDGLYCNECGKELSAVIEEIQNMDCTKQAV